MSKLLTTKEVAEMIGLHSETIVQSRIKGTLLGREAPKHKKMGRLVRYEQEVIEKWISEE